MGRYYLILWLVKEKVNLFIHLFRNKDTTCQFAHTQDELRAKDEAFKGMVFGSGTFGFGIGGSGFGPSPAGPSVPPLPPQGADPLYKTKVKLCKARLRKKAALAAGQL